MLIPCISFCQIDLCNATDSLMLLNKPLGICQLTPLLFSDQFFQLQKICQRLLIDS
jgi:hypothetical protein